MIQSLKKRLPWLPRETVIDRRSRIKQDQRGSKNDVADQVLGGSQVNCPDDQKHNPGDTEPDTDPVSDAVSKHLAFGR